MLLLFGCQSLPWKRGEMAEKRADTPTLNQVFYGFPDIPVPKELKFEAEKSFIYEAAGLKAGVLVFSGNVDLESLKGYFKTAMARNGWKFLNSFEWREVVMNFSKEERFCHIHISRGALYTEATLWIGPVEKKAKERELEKREGVVLQ
jgi:hypothetical protein